MGDGLFRPAHPPQHGIVLDKVGNRGVRVEVVARIVLPRRRGDRELHLAVIEAEIARSSRGFALSARTGHKQRESEGREHRCALHWLSPHS